MVKTINVSDYHNVIVCIRSTDGAGLGCSKRICKRLSGLSPAGQPEDRPGKLLFRQATLALLAFHEHAETSGVIGLVSTKNDEFGQSSKYGLSLI